MSVPVSRCSIISTRVRSAYWALRRWPCCLATGSRAPDGCGHLSWRTHCRISRGWSRIAVADARGFRSIESDRLVEEGGIDAAPPRDPKGIVTCLSIVWRARQPGPSGRTRHDRQHPPRTEDRAILRARPAYPMVEVSQSSLGMPDSDRLLEHRGVHHQGAGHLLPPLLHRHCLPLGPHCRHHTAPRQSMDHFQARPTASTPGRNAELLPSPRRVSPFEFSDITG
jgi:hypothetical protein